MKNEKKNRKGKEYKKKREDRGGQFPVKLEGNERTKCRNVKDREKKNG